VASAGTVEIDFAAETAKFTAELKKIRAQLNDLSKATQLIGKTFQSAGNLLKGAFAGITVASAIRAVVRATSEAEESTAKLNNALKNSSASISLTTKQLANYATELQHTSTFGDEAIQDVESLLLSFKGLSGETILKATSAVVDLSTRMGTDLHSAALQVGRSLQDPIKGLAALSRAGVSFSSEQQTTIKRLTETGNLAKAQGIILAELEKRFGGAAAAARDTFGGALKGLSNDFDNLLEANGGMPAATSAVNELSKVLQDPETKKGVDNLIAGIGRLIEVAAKAAASLPKLSSAIASLFPGTAQFPTVVAALEKELVLEQARFEAFKSNFPLLKERIAQEQAFIETLKERIALAREAAAAPQPDIEPVTVSVQTKAIAPESPFGTEAFGKQLQLRQQLLTASIATMANQLDAFDAAITERDKKYVEGHAAINATTQDLLQSRVQANIDATQQEVSATLEAERQKYQAVVQFEAQKKALQQSTFAAAAGLLSALAVRSKAAARAQILLNRGLMIAQAVQNTAAAVMGAMASVPYPANLAAAAQVKAIGAIQIGLIAATGAIELGNVGSGNAGGIGGTSLGTPSNPLPVSPTSQGATGGRVINLNLNGPIAGPEASQWLVDAIGDLINGNDTIIINGNSRQAQEIRGG
jgi:hypothetical protein